MLTVDEEILKKSTYLAIDPGEGGTTGGTGWCLFDRKGNATAYGQVKTPDLTKVLTEILHSGLLGVVVEDYRNHGWTQQKKWSKNVTSKHIGKIEMLAEMRSVPVHLQPNTVKSIGYMWMGMEPPTNHAISHQFDAMAHGVYWLQSSGIRPVGKSLLDKLKNDTE